jgi:hypothetical protein
MLLAAPVVPMSAPSQAPMNPLAVCVADRLPVPAADVWTRSEISQLVVLTPPCRCAKPVGAVQVPPSPLKLVAP